MSKNVACERNLKKLALLCLKRQRVRRNRMFFCKDCCEESEDNLFFMHIGWDKSNKFKLPGTAVLEQT